MTNREWLESLSDEELAKLILESTDCDFCAYQANSIDCYDKSCKTGHLTWLQAEHKESEQ